MWLLPVFSKSLTAPVYVCGLALSCCIHIVFPFIHGILASMKSNSPYTCSEEGLHTAVHHPPSLKRSQCCMAISTIALLCFPVRLLPILQCATKFGDNTSLTDDHQTQKRYGPYLMNQEGYEVEIMRNRNRRLRGKWWRVWIFMILFFFAYLPADNILR